jgi:Domain of unknown function (DUF4359)
MRALIVTIVAIAVLGLLALTNPKMSDYEQFVHGQIVRKGERADQVTKAFGLLFGGLQSSLAANATKRTDYVFFSTYRTTLGDEDVEYLGALNNFVAIKSPPAEEQPKVGQAG